MTEENIIWMQVPLSPPKTQCKEDTTYTTATVKITPTEKTPEEIFA